MEKSHKLVEYILLAEFDIDTGSTLKIQYPSRIDGYSDDWFAENMLPEGAHNRDADLTYLLLNRASPIILDDDKQYYNPALVNAKSDGSTGSKFLYGVNRVTTKHDSAVRRGAIVKALAVFSHFHFIEQFKPVLEKALECYYSNPSAHVLEELFETLNAYDISDILREKRNAIDSQFMRRGVAYNTLKSKISSHCPPHWLAKVHSPLTYRDSIFEISIPLYHTVWEFGSISLINLIKTFGEMTMKIYHAILTKQRVLFVGYNQPTSYIGQMVLSSVAMVSPPIPDVIRRAYAYANLSDLSFLEVGLQAISMNIYFFLAGFIRLFSLFQCDRYLALYLGLRIRCFNNEIVGGICFAF
jgi:hypothetical protein